MTMTYSDFLSLPVEDSIADALLNPVSKKGSPYRFLLADTVEPKGPNRGQLISGVNSKQVILTKMQSNLQGAPGVNRVSYFERIEQEKCCGTTGTMTTKHSASYGLDMVYPGPYPGKGHAGYVIKSVILEM